MHTQTPSTDNSSLPTSDTNDTNDNQNGHSPAKLQFIPQQGARFRVRYRETSHGTSCLLCRSDSGNG